jgi:murein DD-endopeptidase MepM/ murein hydrolase activator NlpD
VRVACALAIALSLLIPEAARVGADELSERISSARQRQAELNRAVARQNELLKELKADGAVADTALASTRRQLGGINADQAALRADINAATKAIERIQSRRDALVAELGTLDWTLDLLEQEIAQGADELQARRRLLGTRLAEAYRVQNTSLLEQIIGTGSFTDVISRSSTYLAYGDEDVQLAQDIATDQAALDQLRALTAATRYRTDLLRRDATATELDLRARKGALADARAQLAKLEARVRVIQARQLARARQILAHKRQAQRMIAQHEAAERKLDRKIAGLMRRMQRRADRHSGGGRLEEGNGRFDWPARGYVSQEYGCTGFPLEPPRGSCAHFHDGIDIANGYGTPIRAPESGVVAFVGWNPYDPSNPSFIVLIAHGDGWASYLGHLQSRYVVRQGEYVRKGQLVGYMGMTGNTTGSHVHWEIRHRGHTLDPRDYV